MTTIVTNSQVRQICLGRFVQGAAKTVPQNATQTIFTVSGGRILVTLLQGVVTTIIGGTAPSAKLTSTPTTGTAVDFATATSISGKEIGALISYATPLGALDVQNAGAGKAPTAEVYIPIGTIGVNVSAADATGAIQWTLCYVPIDAAATVVAN